MTDAEAKKKANAADARRSRARKKAKAALSLGVDLTEKSLTPKALQLEAERVAGSLDLSTVSGTLDAAKEAVSIVWRDKSTDSGTKARILLGAARIALEARQYSLEAEAVAMRATIERLREAKSAA